MRRRSGNDVALKSDQSSGSHYLTIRSAVSVPLCVIRCDSIVSSPSRNEKELFWVQIGKFSSSLSRTRGAVQMGRERKRMYWYTKDGPVHSCMLSSHSTEFPDPELTFSGSYCACADGSSLRGNYRPPLEVLMFLLFTYPENWLHTDFNRRTIEIPKCTRILKRKTTFQRFIMYPVS